MLSVTCREYLGGLFRVQLGHQGAFNAKREQLLLGALRGKSLKELPSLRSGLLLDPFAT
jgi:hypothetical protein